MITYEITKKDEDLQFSTITKKGAEIDFSVYEAIGNATAYEKSKKELTAKLDNCKMWAANIEEHHEFIKELTEEQLYIAHKYQEEKAMIKAIEPKLAEIEEVLEAHNKEMEEIIKQIPEMKSVIKPE